MAFNTTRWTLANILPVLFVVKIIACLWLLYVFLHLVPLLQSQHHDAYQRGIWQTVFSQIVTVLILTCFVRAIVTDPGSVPQTPEWQQARKDTPSKEDLTAEVKQTGGPRFCKWCNQYKPDRCHHCRVCRSCILRMDHHCPWIANCVGFRNHKFFLLLVFHAMVNCIFICVTMSETIVAAVNEEMTPLRRFGIVYCITLASLMSILLVPFLLLHISFLVRAQTTIEFCEKRSKKHGAPVSYSRGLLENTRAVLGPYMILWLLPLSPPQGDGVTFQVSVDGDEPLLKDQREPPDEPAPDSAQDPAVAETEQSSKASADATAGSSIASDEITSKAVDDGISKEGVGESADDAAPEVTGARAAEV